MQLDARRELWILAAGALLVLLAFAAERGVETVGAVRFLDNLHWTAGYATTTLLAWLHWRRALPGQRREHAWFLAGSAGYTLGQMLWDVQVAIEWNPFPGPSDAFFILLGPCLGIGLVQALRRHVPREYLRSATLDIAGLSIAALALTLAFYLPRRGGIGWPQMIVYVAYPAFLLGASSIGLVLLVYVRPKPHPGWLLFLAALALDGGLWLHWNSLTIDGALADGTVFNLGFSLAALLLGAGIWAWKIEPAVSGTWRRACERAQRSLPVLLPVIGIAGAVLAREIADVPPVASWCIASGAGLVLLLALARQSLLNAELEDRVHERTAALAAANRELETFAYSVSHDLKVPLRGIDGFSALVLEDYAPALPAEARGHLQQVRRSTQQMQRLIDDLLAYSRLERLALEPALVEPRALVEEWSAERAADLRLAHARLCDELPAFRLRADRQGLTIALRNLLDNALKFSSRAAEPSITVAVSEGQGHWRISVRDNGIGFDMQYHEWIFGIFQRLDGESEYPGTGVGLAMVRRSVERMGGRVWAESTPGQGATFYVELPK